jgi:hypothetical protein
LLILAVRRNPSTMRASHAPPSRRPPKKSRMLRCDCLSRR